MAYTPYVSQVGSWANSPSSNVSVPASNTLPVYGNPDLGGAWNQGSTSIPQVATVGNFNVGGATQIPVARAPSIPTVARVPTTPQNNIPIATASKEVVFGSTLTAVGLVEAAANASRVSSSDAKVTVAATPGVSQSDATALIKAQVAKDASTVQKLTLSPTGTIQVKSEPTTLSITESLKKSNEALKTLEVLNTNINALLYTPTSPNLILMTPEQVQSVQSVYRPATDLLNPATLGTIIALTSRNPDLMPLTTGVATVIGMLDIPNDVASSGDITKITAAVQDAYSANPNLLAKQTEFLDAIAGEGGQIKLKTQSVEDYSKIQDTLALKQNALSQLRGGKNAAPEEDALIKLYPDLYEAVVNGNVSYDDAISKIADLNHISLMTLEAYNTMQQQKNNISAWHGTQSELDSYKAIESQKLIMDTFNGLPEDQRTAEALGRIVGATGLGFSTQVNEENQAWLQSDRLESDLADRGFWGDSKEGIVNFFKDPSNSPLLLIGGAGIGAAGGLLAAGKVNWVLKGTHAANEASSIIQAGKSVAASGYLINVLTKITPGGTTIGKMVTGGVIGGFLGTEGANLVVSSSFLLRSALSDQGATGQQLLNKYDGYDITMSQALSGMKADKASGDVKGYQQNLDAFRVALDAQEALIVANSAMFTQQDRLEATQNYLTVREGQHSEAVLPFYDGTGKISYLTIANPETVDNVLINGVSWKVPADGKIPFTGDKASVKLTTFDGKSIDYGELTQSSGSIKLDGSVVAKLPAPGEVEKEQRFVQSGIDAAEERSAAKNTIVPVTLYVEAGQTAEMLGKIYTGGKEGTSYLIQAVPGTQAAITYTQPGKETKVSRPYVQDLPTQTWYNALDNAFTEKATYSTLAPNIREGQTLTIDGKEIVNPARLALLDVTPGLHSIVISEPGKEDYKTTVNAFAGEKIAIAGEGKEPFVPYKGTGSSGGGGGGGGGGSSGGSAAAQTMVVFGDTLVGARLWLDGVEITPALGTSYATTAGYHAFKATKAGYQDYEKQVYAMDGQTLHVDVVFSANTSTPSTSAGTTLIFGTSLKDARVWLDEVEIAPEIGKAYAVTAGYHAVKATKPGFVDWSKSVFIAADSSISVDAVWEAVAVVVLVDTKAKAVFGAAVSGASVYLDEVFTSVEVGIVYELAVGYHGIRMSKPGFSDWIKTVYMQAGDTLTVSPAFEPLPVDTYVPSVVIQDTSSRVFINTDVPSSKILINNGFTGQWTPSYIDLEKGLYKLTCQKSGYEDYNDYIYVGDTIAFGQTALALASMIGLEVPQ